MFLNATSPAVIAEQCRWPGLGAMQAIRRIQGHALVQQIECDRRRAAANKCAEQYAQRLAETQARASV